MLPTVSRLDAGWRDFSREFRRLFAEYSQAHRPNFKTEEQEDKNLLIKLADVQGSRWPVNVGSEIERDLRCEITDLERNFLTIDNVNQWNVATRLEVFHDSSYFIHL